MHAVSTESVSPHRLTSLMRGSVLGDEVAVVDVESEVLTGGLMADTLALSLRYTGGTGDEPDNMVVKLPSSNPDSHAMGMELGNYAREITFYSELASRLAIRVPHCYHASIDKEAQTFVLLLEDARPAQIPYPEMDNFRAVCEQAIRELARFHASTWGDSSYKGHPDIPVALNSSNLSKELEVAEKGWRLFQPLVEEVCSPEDVSRLERIVASARQWKFSGEQASCLIHGDFRYANLLYTASGEVVTLDWQTFNWNNPGSDLAHFLLLSLSPQQREDWIESLLDTYLQELSDHGVKGYSNEQLAFDFRIGILNEVIMLMATVFAIGANGLSEPARMQMLGGLGKIVPAIQRYDVMTIVDEEN